MSGANEDLNLPWDADFEFAIRDSNGEIFVEIFAGDAAKNEKVASHIVRACNSHYELVEALESVLDALGTMNKPHELHSWGFTEAEAQKVFAALAKAKGEA